MDGSRGGHVGLSRLGKRLAQHWQLGGAACRRGPTCPHSRSIPCCREIRQEVVCRVYFVYQQALSGKLLRAELIFAQMRFSPYLQVRMQMFPELESAVALAPGISARSRE